MIFKRRHPILSSWASRKQSERFLLFFVERNLFVEIEFAVGLS